MRSKELNELAFSVHWKVEKWFRDIESKKNEKSDTTYYNRHTKKLRVN